MWLPACCLSSSPTLPPHSVSDRAGPGLPVHLEKLPCEPFRIVRVVAAFAAVALLAVNVARDAQVQVFYTDYYAAMHDSTDIYRSIQWTY